MQKMIFLVVAFLFLVVGLVVLFKYQASNALKSAQVEITQKEQTQIPPTPTPQLAVSNEPVTQIALTITSPTEGQLLQTATVVVRGKTVPNAQVAVDDVEVTADASGNFQASVTLDEGQNDIVVVANDANGNYAEKDVQVTYNAGQ